MRRLDLDGLLHWFTQRTIFLRSDSDAPGASGFEFDSARGFASLDFAGAFGGDDSSCFCGFCEFCCDAIGGASFGGEGCYEWIRDPRCTPCD